MKQWPQPRKSLTCALLALCGTFLLYFYITRTVPEFNQYRLVRQYQREGGPTVRVPRTILLWNDIFGEKRWNFPDDTLGPSYFRDVMQCPVYQCELTNVRDFLASVKLFDAVVFHAAQPFPLLQPVPSERSLRQLYVFAVMEPPGETKHILNDEDNFYNLTMTYRLDSDILWPYQCILHENSGDFVAPKIDAVWRQPPATWNDTTVWNLWHGKTRTAAWFVSHCSTLSQREKLAAALQRYIDVDIYGKCGTLSCPRSSVGSSSDCDKMLDQKYKFYFAFENSLCADYVTEKVYNALQRNVVPVVFGGANYTRFLPPHSYIDAESFASVEQLATYIRKLAGNPGEYMRYFWWRPYYRITNYSPFCELCRKLNSVPYQQKMQTYLNIEKWWLAKSCRLEAKINFEDVR